MRVSRLLVAACVAASVLVVPMAPSAGAAVDCFGPFEAAIQNPPPRPTAGQIIDLGPPLTIDGNVVRDYALSVSLHFANAGAAYSLCEAQRTRDGAVDMANCIRGSQAVQALLGGTAPSRYVTLNELQIKVHHDVALSDANQLYNCLGVNINIT